MTDAPWLSEAEIAKITRRIKPSAQARVLDAMGVPYRRRLDGSIFVGRVHFEQPTAPVEPEPFVFTPKPERPQRAWEDTPLGKWQAEQRLMAEGRKAYLPTPEQIAARIKR